MASDPDEEYDDDELNVMTTTRRPQVGVTVEIVGLSLYTHHGVTAAERESVSGWCSTCASTSASPTP